MQVCTPVGFINESDIEDLVMENLRHMIELFVCASDSGAIDGEEKDGVLSFGEFSGPLSQVCRFHTTYTLL